MSGTSLDGVDLAFCTFSLVEDRWTFTTEATETYTYTDEWLEVLRSLHLQSAPQIFEVDAALGRYGGYGLGGQSLLIDRTTNTVVVKLSSWPKRTDPLLASFADVANEALFEWLRRN